MKKKIRILVIWLLFGLVCIWMNAQASNFSFDANNNLWTMEQASNSLVSINKEKVTETVLQLRDNAVVFLKDEISSVKNNKNLITDDKYFVTSLDDFSFSVTGVSFDDIDNSLYKTYVHVLKENKIVDWHSNKYYPENDMRLYAFVKMVVESYRTKMWYNLDRNVWLTRNSYLKEIDFDRQIEKYINTAYELWFLDDIVSNYSTNKTFNKLVDYKILKQMFSNIRSQFPGYVNDSYFNTLYGSDIILKRWKIAEHIVKFFELSLDNKQQRHFDDTSYNENGKYVELLGDLWIVNTVNSEFFIGKNTCRADFVVMLSRILQRQLWDVVSESNVQLISDIQGQPYYFDVIYLDQLGYLDYLLEVKRNKKYFYPDRDITKHEIYYILMQITNIVVPYDQKEADTSFMSRWSVAKLLVELFNLWDVYLQIEWNSPTNILYLENRKTDNVWILEDIYESLQDLWEILS